MPGQPCVKAETPPAQGGCSRVPGGVGIWGMPMGDPGGLRGEVAAPREGFSWLSSTGTCVGLGANKGPSWLLPGLCERPFKFQTSSRAK